MTNTHSALSSSRPRWHGTLAIIAIGFAGCHNSQSPAAPSGPTQGAIPVVGVVLDTAYRYLRMHSSTRRVMLGVPREPGKTLKLS
jgi:hypothetical protein